MIATIRENEPITNNTMLEKSRNTSIDIMRLVMAILVVSIHTEPLSEFHTVLGFFATEIIPRAAVPFFFAISGYYFYGKQDLKSQFKAIYKVVLLYCLVSVVFWATDFSMKVLCQEARVCANDIFGYLAGKKFGFLISGSWYHLWYFPALIYSMVICSVLQKLRLKNLIYPLSCILYIIGVIGCAYYAIAIQIPILKVIYDNQFFEIIRRIFCMGFPFFSLGLFTRQVKLGGGNKKHILILSLICFFIEIFLVYFLKIYSTVVLTFGLYFVVFSLLQYLLDDPWENHPNLGIYSKRTASVMYYFHPLLLLGMGYGTGTLKFLITVFFFMAVGGVIYIWKKRLRVPNR